MRHITPATEADRARITASIETLREARRLLRAARAKVAARAVGRAIKSAEGAARHVSHRIRRTAR